MPQTKPGASSLFQDVVAVVINTQADEASIRFVDEVCTASGGHAVALLTPPLPDVFYAGDAMSSGNVWAMVMEELAKHAKKETDELKARLAKTSTTFEFRTTPLHFVLSKQAVLMNARHADITVFTRPDFAGDKVYFHELLEAVLFQSGRPLLLLPRGWAKPASFRKVLVAWKPSREAVRAVADAGPILESADAVTIVTVDAEPSTVGPGDQPGVDIATHLSRRGAKVEVRNVDSMGRSDADAILSTAREIGADLIVLGAYGHSRLRQMVFGGVTKHLTASADIPLLLAH